jgi:hypothetical protein
MLAFAHNEIGNPLLHAALDILTVAVLTSPLWTEYLWLAGRRRTRRT